MARYNTSLASATITGTATIGTPNSGAFTALTGTGGYTVTLPSPALFPGSNQIFYNATSPSGTVTLSTPVGIFTGTGGTNSPTVLCYAGNVLSVTSDGTNYIVISEDGSALVATTGSFSGDVTMNGSSATVSLTPTTVTIAPVNTSNINNMNIGASTRGSGAFNSLTANSAVTFTANTASTTTGTGSLVVTGGVGVSGQLTATSVSATNLTGTVQTAAQPNITAIGPSSAVFIDGSGNVGINNTNPTKSARFVVNTQGRNDGGITKIATGAIVSGASSDTPSNLFSASTAIFRVHASDQTNNLQFGIGLGGYGYAPWIQGSYDNNSSPGGASAGATNLILQPIGGNVGINTRTPDAKLVINLGQSAYNQGLPGTSGSSTTAGLRIKAGDGTYGETLDFGINVATSYSWIQSTNYSGLATNYPLILNPNGGNVGIGTTDFSAGYTFNVARRARFNGMMLGNGDGSTASDNRIGLDWSSGQYAQIVAQQNVPLYLGVGGSTKVALDSGGHWLPLTNDTQNLGSATQAWANIYTNDLHLNNETKVNGNDVDGTTGNWTIQEGAENLYIINNNTGKRYAFALREIE